MRVRVRMCVNRYLVKAYQQSQRHRGVTIPKGSTSYLFETLAGKCPLSNLMLVDDLIETFKHRASRSFLLFPVFSIFCCSTEFSAWLMQLCMLV